MLPRLCRSVCVCLGWKSGAGTINISALSFTPWGGAIVTPRLKKQTGRPFSPLTSAVTNCKLYLFFSLFFFFFYCISLFVLSIFYYFCIFDRTNTHVKKRTILISVNGV